MQTEKGTRTMPIAQHYLDVTTMFQAYRMGFKSLWNNFVAVHGKKMDWNDSDELELISCKIFRIFVLNPLKIFDMEKTPSYMSVQLHLEPFEVIPNQNSVVHVAIEPCAWNTDLNPALCKTAKFSFVDLYDFVSLKKRKFEYLKIRITDCDDRSLIGKDALVKFCDATVRLRMPAQSKMEFICQGKLGVQK